MVFEEGGSMLGELIGLGLMGLAAKLGATQADKELYQLYEAYITRWLYDDFLDFQETSDVFQWPPVEDYPYRSKRPCTLKMRRALRDFNDTLDNFRREVIRAPGFVPKKMIDICVEETVRTAPKSSSVLDPDPDPRAIKEDCIHWFWERADQLEWMIRGTMDYEKQLKTECPAIWTEDQGLEGYVTQEGPRRFCVRNEPTRRIIKTKSGPRCYPTRKQAVKVWHALDCKYTGRHC